MKDIGEEPAQKKEEQDLSTENASLRTRLDEVEKERDQLASIAKEYLDTAKRLQAEFDNYKKRTGREREDLIKNANERLLADLLLVVDDLERAIGSKCSHEEFKDGVGKIHDNISSLLKDYGIKEIPTDGDFNPQIPRGIGHRGRGRWEGPGCVPERILPWH